MSLGQEITQGEHSSLERLRHSMALLIFLDLGTLGLYSAARTYWVHAELSRKTGRRLFSIAFLHILIVLHLLLWVLRFSRESIPWDAAVIMARLGAGLLMITLLLIFRRTLIHDFQLRIRAWPLAVIGFWYLQLTINRGQRNAFPTRARESRLVPALIIAVSTTMALVLGTVKHCRISTTAMEPTLVVGDHVLVDQLSYLLDGMPQRGELLVYKSVQDPDRIQVKRVLGLPGDRLVFHEDLILLNGKPLPCHQAGQVVPGNDTLDQTVRRLFDCEIDGRRFTLHYYKEGALTAIQGDFEVPRDHYFLIGDNLDNSPDSRTIGPIPAHNVLGHARITTISYRFGESILWHRWFQPL